MREKMEYLDHSLATPAENLALDEALLLERVAGARRDGESNAVEVLRVWESREYFAVLGVSGEIARELDVSACESAGVAILRRHSGGGTVLQGPGCLNFSLILSEERPGFQNFTHSYEEILARVAGALQYSGLSHRGTSDLAIGQMKISGNAQKRSGGTLLHHGTILYDFDLQLIPQFLAEPEKRPPYRDDRCHDEFVCNLPIEPQVIKERLQLSWEATTLRTRPLPSLTQLVEEKYGNRDWTCRF